MVILSKIICNSVLKQYWEYRISRAKTINIDFISQNILLLLSEHYKDCDISTRLYVCINRDYQHLNYWRTCPCSIFHTYNQENNGNFILGPKPPGPNQERAETSWGRTGKGPKPLAFLKTTFKTAQAAGFWEGGGCTGPTGDLSGPQTPRLCIHFFRNPATRPTPLVKVFIDYVQAARCSCYDWILHWQG